MYSSTLHTFSNDQYQYSFIHDAVLESFICGHTRIQPLDLRNAVKTLGQRDEQSGRTGFETQFHVKEIA